MSRKLETLGSQYIKLQELFSTMYRLEIRLQRAVQRVAFRSHTYTRSLRGDGPAFFRYMAKEDYQQAKDELKATTTEYDAYFGLLYCRWAELKNNIPEDTRKMIRMPSSSYEVIQKATELITEQDDNFILF